MAVIGAGSAGFSAAIAAAEATLDGGDAGPLVEDVPAQLGLLALKIVWARRVEGALNGGTGGGWFSRALSGGKQMPQVTGQLATTSALKGYPVQYVKKFEHS